MSTAITTTAIASTAHRTPVGTLLLDASDTGISRCVFARSRRGPAVDEPPEPARAPTSDAERWLAMAGDELDRYFAGSLRTFTVPVDLGSVPSFDRQVLDALGTVEYGTTTSYGRLAKRIGLGPAAARDVGQALAHNPVLVLVPCHRVVGADGALVGYVGGLSVKRRLLDLESAASTPRLDLLW